MAQIRDVVIDGATVVAALSSISLAVAVALGHSGANSGLPDDLQRTIPDWQEYAEEGHRIGPDGPAVTIVWWGDYECPFSRRLAPAVKALLETHRDQVAVVYRHWPLPSHPAARPAARAGICAGAQGAFRSIHDLLYAGTDWMAESTQGLLRVAEEAGVPDLREFEGCLGDSDVNQLIELDISAVKGLGATGVPMVMVNDLLLGTVPDSLGLVELVQERLGG